MTMNKTYTSWNGQPFFLYSSLIYHNGKAFAQLSSNLTVRFSSLWIAVLTFGTKQPFFVDLVSGQTVATPQNWVAVDRNFAFSTGTYLHIMSTVSELLIFNIHISRPNGARARSCWEIALLWNHGIRVGHVESERPWQSAWHWQRHNFCKSLVLGISYWCTNMAMLRALWSSTTTAVFTWELITWSAR